MDGLDLRVPPTSLRQAWAPLHVDVAADLEVTGITVDSTEVLPGMVFAALQGQRTHGARFAADAAARGAAAILTDPAGASLVDSVFEDGSLLVVVVPDPRAQLGALSAAVYGHPADRLLTFGVTGTNGKTTATWLIESGLRAAGRRPAVFGTLGMRLGDVTLASPRTTPEAPQLQAMLAHALRSGADSVALEVSSHALQLGRVDGFVVDVAGFTNLAQDHLDFHGTMAAYEAAKQRLFTPAHARRAVVDVDSDAGERIASRATVPVERLRLGARDYLPVTDWRILPGEALDPVGHRVELQHGDRTAAAFDVALPGQFNLSNAGLAAAMLLTAGVPAGAVSAGVGAFRGVPGRMELVDRGQPFVALVDYAHTPDALHAVLLSLRATRDGRLVVVFGCGGDRDRTKRPLMGRVAASVADVVVVTDDNPRSEDPAAIRREVLAGAASAGAEAQVLDVGDRAEAIRTGVRLAGSGDTLVVAGKGHEAGQQVGDVMLPFDDRSALAAALDAEGNRAT